MNPMHDTIAAIATAPGTAGLAVVRLSGAHATAIADRVFRGAAPLADVASHTLHHGWAVWPAHGTGDDHRLDETVAAVFLAPRSYTRENVVEFSCHGGRLPAERVLEALLAAGARLAGPGEFTQRAFVNGRIDLVQAEAVADLIEAETEGARELALAQLAGGLSRRLDAIADHLADAVAEVEARVDFAEDVGGVEVPPHVVRAVVAVERELAALLAGAAWARAVREGVRVPIVGRPNVGKSSLFNALIGEDRAIVTAVPGTTRDRVSEAVEVAGVRVTLSDTAGLRDSADTVESIGIARTREALADAPLVLWVVDGSVALESEDRGIAAALEGKRVLVAINKSDAGHVTGKAGLGPLLEAAAFEAIGVSALTGEGLSELLAAFARMLGAGGPGVGGSSAAGNVSNVPHGTLPAAGPGDAPVAVAVPSTTAQGVAFAGAVTVAGIPAGLADAVSNRRHVDALMRARAALTRGKEAARDGLPGELIALELREALAAVGEVTGRVIGEDLLDRIFSRFCIGK
jgi:tRNA modification GTPase